MSEDKQDQGGLGEEDNTQKMYHQVQESGGVTTYQPIPEEHLERVEKGLNKLTTEGPDRAELPVPPPKSTPENAQVEGVKQAVVEGDRDIVSQSDYKAFVAGAQVERDQKTDESNLVGIEPPQESSRVIPDVSLTPLADRLGPVEPGSVPSPSAQRQDISEVRAGLNQGFISKVKGFLRR